MQRLPVSHGKANRTEPVASHGTHTFNDVVVRLDITVHPNLQAEYLAVLYNFCGSLWHTWSPLSCKWCYAA